MTIDVMLTKIPELTQRGYLLSSTSMVEPRYAKAGFVAAVFTFFTTTAVGMFIGRVVLAFALSALAAALAPKPKAPEGGIQTDVTMMGTNPQKIMCGYYCTAGSWACPPMTRDDGNTKNGFVHYVTAVSDYPVNKIGPDVIIDGKNASILTILEDDGYKLSGEYSGYGWIKPYTGNQTTADARLVSLFTNYVRPWKNTAVLKGVAYNTVCFKYKDSLFTGLPNVKFVVEGAKFYDFRKDTTNGGSGTHRFSNPATWAYTENPVVIIYNIIRGITMPDGLVYGIGAEAADFNMPQWIAAANVCDETVTYDDDYSEHRYRAGYEISSDQQPLDVIQELLKACGGLMAEEGGVFHISVGPPDAPVASFSDDDIIISESIETDPFMPLADNYNVIKATYPSPAELWESTEAQDYSVAAWVAQDQGMELVTQMEFDAVFAPRQVRRLMREMLTDHRRRAVATITMPPSYNNIHVFDIVSWTSANRGYNDKLFEVQRIYIAPDTLNVTLQLRERDPSDYDFSAASDSVVPEPPIITPHRPTITGVPGFAFSATSILDSTSKGRTPALSIIWAADAGFDSIEYQIQVVGGKQIINGSTTAVDHGVLLITSGILSVTSYKCRVRPIRAGVATDWTSWVTATTGDYRITEDDFTSGVWTAIENSVAGSGIRTVSTLPATGARDNEIVLLLPPGKLMRWTGTEWTDAVYADIEAGSLDASAFASSIEPVSIVAGSVVPTTKTTSMIYLVGTRKMYRWNGTAYIATVASTDITGTLTDAQIAALDSSKLTGTLSADLIGANTITANKLVLSDNTNIVPNGYMDQSGAVVSDYWVPNANATLSWSTAGTVGLYSLSLLKTTTTTSASATSKQAIPVVGGDSLYCKIKWKSATSATDTAGYYFRVNWYKADGTASATALTDVAANQPITTAWQTAEKSVVVPSDAATCKITIISHSTNTLVANVLTDFVAVKKMSGGELIVDGTISGNKILANSITAGQIAAGAISTDELAANSVQAKHMVITDTTNLLANGGMDQFGASFADYWTVSNCEGSYSNTFAIAATAPSVTGLYDIVMDKTAYPGVSTSISSKQMFPVIGGDQLWTSIRFKSADAETSASGFYARIFWYDADKVYVGATGDIVSNVGIPSAWSVVNTSLTVPGTAKFGRVILTNAATNTTANTVVVDHLFIRKKGNGSLIVDGTITTNALAAGSVTTDKLVAGSVVASTIAAGVINGDHIGAGTIDASHIQSGSIDVTRLKTSSFQSTGLALFGGTLKSSNYSAGSSGWQITSAGAAEFNSLVVRQGNLAAGSTAVGNGATGTSNVTCNSTSYTTILSTTITTTGGGVLVIGTCAFEGASGVGVQISRDSSTLMTKNYAGTSWVVGDANIVFWDKPSAGTHTYNLQMNKYSSSVTGSIAHQRSIVAIEFKQA